MHSVFKIFSILACSSTIYAMDSQPGDKDARYTKIVTQQSIKTKLSNEEKFTHLISAANKLGNLFGPSEEDYFRNAICKKYSIARTSTAPDEIKLKIQQSAQLLLSVMEHKYGKLFPKAFNHKTNSCFFKSILSPENSDFQLIQRIYNGDKIPDFLKLAYATKSLENLKEVVGGEDFLEILLDPDHAMNEILKEALQTISKISIPPEDEGESGDDEGVGSSDSEGVENTAYQKLGSTEKNILEQVIQELSKKPISEIFLESQGPFFLMIENYIKDKEIRSNLGTFFRLKSAASTDGARRALQDQFYKEYKENIYNVLFNSQHPLYKTLIQSINLGIQHPHIPVENILSTLENYQIRNLEIAVERYKVGEDQKIEKDSIENVPGESIVEFLKNKVNPKPDKLGTFGSKLILIVGDGGTGKTHLCVGLMKYLESLGKKVCYAYDKCGPIDGYTARDLEPEGPYGSHGAVSRGFLEKDLVLLDDLNIPQGSKYLLEPLIEKYHALSNRILLITANNTNWENDLLKEICQKVVYTRDSKSWEKGVEKWNTEIKENETFKRFFGRFGVMFTKITMKGTNKRFEDHIDPDFEELKKAKPPLQNIQPEFSHHSLLNFQKEWAKYQGEGDKLLKKYQKGWRNYKAKGTRLFSTFQKEMEGVLEPPRIQKKVLSNGQIPQEVHDSFRDKAIKDQKHDDMKLELKENDKLIQKVIPPKTWRNCSIF